MKIITLFSDLAPVRVVVYQSATDPVFYLESVVEGITSVVDGMYDSYEDAVMAGHDLINDLVGTWLEAQS